MSFITTLFKKNSNPDNVGGMQDYMMLVRVYFQASIAAQIGINNIAMLPDLRVFKTTFKVPTQHNKLGMGEKSACRKMMRDMYGHNDDFFREIDKSVAKNCRKVQDMQAYLYQFQGFTQDIMMLVGNLMKFKMRLPSLFKKMLYTMTQKTVSEIFTKNDFSDPATLKAVASVRKYNQHLNFSQQWVTDFVYNVVMLAKKEKPQQQDK